ncbi:MAG: hypothetical protein AAGJ87_08730 [Pseudomonadota bacterium]
MTLLLVIAILAVIPGCAQIPPQMRVVDGKAPANVNEDVRFRTTYFFRVFDYCYDLKAKAQLQPATDSLFRFVMTGKSNAFANKVHFESGTLRADQIDPFGATIEQDEATGRMRFVSQAEVESRARRNETMEEIMALVKLRQNLAALGADTDENDGVDQQILTAIDTKIAEIASAGLSPGRVTTDIVAAADAASIETKTCPPGTQIQRGFQIMGPQGVKTFNQNERLVMAMSTYSKPLINTLQEVSGRIIKAEEQNANASDYLLAIISEQLRASDLSLIKATKEDDANDAAFVRSLRTRLVEGDDASALSQPADHQDEMKALVDKLPRAAAATPPSSTVPVDTAAPTEMPSATPNSPQTPPPNAEQSNEQIAPSPSLLTPEAAVESNAQNEGGSADEREEQ